MKVETSQVNESRVREFIITFHKTLCGLAAGNAAIAEQNQREEPDRPQRCFYGYSLGQAAAARAFELMAVEFGLIEDGLLNPKSKDRRDLAGAPMTEVGRGISASLCPLNLRAQ